MFSSGVMLAVEAVVENLKKMSKPVTTPEEIAQVIQDIKISALFLPIWSCKRRVDRREYFSYRWQLFQQMATKV